VLRLLVLPLILANSGYFVSSQGLLAAYGLAPARQAEPERLAQQILPEAMRLLDEAPAAPPAITAPAPPGRRAESGAAANAYKMKVSTLF